MCILQVAALLCVLTVAVRAVPLPGIEETLHHFPLALSQELSPESVSIAHAPLAVAHTPIIKAVENTVSIYHTSPNS